MSKRQASDAVQSAMRERELTFTALAERLDRPPVWLARLYEIIQVYVPALKALIHEEFGDGIMSAINFRAEVERVPDLAGDRVRITLDGKFLPYQW